MQELHTRGDLKQTFNALASKIIFADTVKTAPDDVCLKLIVGAIFSIGVQQYQTSSDGRVSTGNVFTTIVSMVVGNISVPQQYESLDR
jgi:hypothetical protein